MSPGRRIFPTEGEYNRDKHMGGLDMKTIIVYYSMGGNTEYAAGKIAKETGADLLRLEPEKAYPDKGLRKYFWGGKSAVMQEKPLLRPCAFDADRYDQVVFGFPVWAGTFTPPLRTFLEEHRQAIWGKRLAAFACQSGSGAEKALAKLEAALGKSFYAKLILIDPKDRPKPENDEKIRAFCEAIR